MNGDKMTKAMVKTMKDVIDYFSQQEVNTERDYKTYVGDFFERLTKGLLMHYGEFKGKIESIYFYKNFSKKLKDDLTLPTKDKGTDLIIKLKDEYVVGTELKDRYLVVQAKYCGKTKGAFQYGKLKQFPFDTTKVAGGILVTTKEKQTVDLVNDHRFTQITLKNILEFEENNPEIMESIIKSSFEKKPLKAPKKKAVELRPYQKEFINKSLNHFKTNQKATTLVATGGGKTVMAIELAKRLNKGKKTICMVVPRIDLMRAMSECLATQFPKSYMILVGSRGKGDPQVNFMSTNEDEIQEAIERRPVKNNMICISTYSSIPNLTNVMGRLEQKFDLMIFDECHHLVGTGKLNKEPVLVPEGQKCNIKMLSKWFLEDLASKVSTKILYQTATKKKCVGNKNAIKVCMENEKQFGKVIFRYTLQQAIKDGYAPRYMIMTTGITKTMLDDHHKKFVCMKNKNKKKEGKFVYKEVDSRVLLNAYSCLTAILDGYVSKLIVFVSTQANAKNLKMIIDEYLEDLGENIFCETAVSSDNREYSNTTWDTLNDFKMVDRGILINVNMLVEGIDVPDCDGVCFGNDVASKSKIMQMIGRGTRYKKGKILYIVIPTFIFSDLFDEKGDFTNIRSVLKTLSNFGGLIEEEHIERIFKPVPIKPPRAPHNPVIKDEDEDYEELPVEATFFLKEFEVWRTHLFNYIEDDDVKNASKLEEIMEGKRARGEELVLRKGFYKANAEEVMNEVALNHWIYRYKNKGMKIHKVNEILRKYGIITDKSKDLMYAEAYIEKFMENGKKILTADTEEDARLNRWRHRFCRLHPDDRDPLAETLMKENGVFYEVEEKKLKKKKGKDKKKVEGFDDVTSELDRARFYLTLYNQAKKEGRNLCYRGKADKNDPQQVLESKYHTWFYGMKGKKENYPEVIEFFEENGIKTD